MKCDEIIKVLMQQSPETDACDWDNVGLLVGNREKEVQTVYIALDATDEVVAEAASKGADLLLTHHPLLFKGIKKINSDDFIGRRVIELIQQDMVYYAMHTNFDVAGMAKLAAEILGLSDTSVLLPTGEENGVKKGIGRVGLLPQKMTLRQCAEHTKKTFGIEMVKVYGDLDQPVERVALCPGSGKSTIGDSIKLGAQVLISGDIDHHDGIDAVAAKLSVIDAGHYQLEKIFVWYMKQYLEEKLPSLKVFEQKPKPPYIFV